MSHIDGVGKAVDLSNVPTLPKIASRLDEEYRIQLGYGAAFGVERWWHDASDVVRKAARNLRLAEGYLRDVIKFLVLPDSLIKEIEDFLADMCGTEDERSS